MKPGFVYALQPQGLDLVKIGCTQDPRFRAETLASFSPMPMRFRCVLQVSCFQVAKIFEALLLNLTADVASHGEWRENLPFVDDCFGCIAPAVDVTESYEITLRRPSRRASMSFEKADDLVAVAEAVNLMALDLRAEHGWNASGAARKLLGLNCYTSIVSKKTADKARAELARRRAA